MYKYLLNKKCVVNGCRTTGKDTKKKLFKFPVAAKDDRYSLWVEFSRNPKLDSQARKEAFMCSDHFEVGQFKDSFRQILIQGAMPSRHPGCVYPEPSSSALTLSTPDVESRNNVMVNVSLECPMQIPVFTSTSTPKPFCAWLRVVVFLSPFLTLWLPHLMIASH